MRGWFGCSEEDLPAVEPEVSSDGDKDLMDGQEEKIAEETSHGQPENPPQKQGP
jgi:hypothetical protein